MNWQINTESAMRMDWRKSTKTPDFLKKKIDWFSACLTVWWVKTFSCKRPDFQKNEKSSITIAIPNKSRIAGRMGSKFQSPRQIFDLPFLIDFLRSNQKFGYFRIESSVLLNLLLGIAGTLAANLNKDEKTK